jgi:fimbrial isopeptide formation D2 family protein
MAALPLSASAAGDGSILITTSEGVSVNGKTFKAYQIFTLTTTTEGDGFIYELNPDYAGFEVFYADVLGTMTLNAYILSLLDSSGNLIPAKKGALEALARALWNWSETDNANVLTATGTSTGVLFTGLNSGYYVVAGGALFSGSAADTFAALVTVLDDENEVTNIAIKGDAPKIGKKVLNHLSDGGGGDWENWTDVSITDVVRFKLTATIPDTAYYSQYIYEVHDSLSKGLSFESLISVTAYKGATATALAADVGYTLSARVVDGVTGVTTFTVAIDSDTLIALSEAGNDKIEIIYNAKLNNDAIIEGTGNPNSVYLEYSNDPNWVWDGEPTNKQPTGETPKDYAWVYTYKIDIFKYTGADTPLAGVKFQLFDGNQAAKFIVANGKYVFQGFIAKQTKPGEGADPGVIAAYNAYLAETVLETGPGGMIYIVGVDEGGYTLSEFQALNGYNTVGDITVTVYNALSDDVDIEDMDDLIGYLNTNCGEAGSGASLLNYATFLGAASVGVFNGKGFIFPGTGGIGTTVFYVVSAILTAGLLVFFITRRRRNALQGKLRNTVVSG